MEAKADNVTNVWRFTWTIDNFSGLKNTKHYSDVFSADGYKWQVLIFPKGNNVKFFSMYLAIADSNLPDGWSRHAEFSLSLVNQISCEINKRETRHTFKADERDRGFTKFMSLAELNDPSKGFLVKDKLIVRAEILAHTNQGAKTDTTTICPNCAVEGEPSLSPDLRKLKIQVFEDMPQNPHYAPLDKYSDKVREGMIIGLDIAFVNLSQEIRKLKDPETFWSKLEGFMKQLMELEEMGYNVEMLREHLQALKRHADCDRAAKEAIKQFEAEMQEHEKKITEYKALIDKIKNDSVDALNGFESTTECMRK